jgi:hypothetical protein
MLYRERRAKPSAWAEYKTKARHWFTLPFVAIDWVWEWVACFLSNWAFLEALEYLSSFGVLVAVIFYFAEHGERTRQRHLQMWQVMNTAQGKGGSGGRIEALEELNADHVPLVGVDVSGAFLGGVKLKKAELLRANFSAADARDGAAARQFQRRGRSRRRFYRRGFSFRGLAIRKFSRWPLRWSESARCKFRGGGLHRRRLKRCRSGRSGFVGRGPPHGGIARRAMGRHRKHQRREYLRDQGRPGRFRGLGAEERSRRDGAVMDHANSGFLGQTRPSE